MFLELSMTRAVGGELVQEFVEVESGSKIQRPMLGEAIALAKAYNATLIWSSSYVKD